MTSDIRVMNDRKTSFFKPFGVPDSTNTCVRTSGLARGDGESWTYRHLGSVQTTSTLNRLFHFALFEYVFRFSLPVLRSFASLTPAVAEDTRCAANM